MTTAQRIKYLMDKHCHSVREASRKTGVPKTTLLRLLEGSEANLSKWVSFIARGYEVDPDALLGGKDPRSDFEWSVRRASCRERFDMVLMTMQERLRMTLDFLTKAYPRRCSLVQIAGASGLALRDVEVLRAIWEQTPPDLVTAKALALGIVEVTGIPGVWFLYGLLEDEPTFTRLSRALPKAGVLAQKSRMKGKGTLTKQLIDFANRRHGRHGYYQLP